MGYVMARELRKQGFESDLLVLPTMVERQNYWSINDPLMQEKDVKAYPSWISFFPKKNNKILKMYDLIKIMRKYDLVHAYTNLSRVAMLSGKPYLAEGGGDDIRVHAFEKSLRGYLLRRAYRKANQFVYVWPIQKPYVEKLGIKNAIYLPRLWDTSNFSREKMKKSEGSTLKIFLPTMEDWDLKGNDKFLKAFVRLCKESKDVFLYYVDWGKDAHRAKELLTLPEVKDKVEIIPGPITREKVFEFMEKSDLMVEQFNTGAFTRIGMEAFAFGLPILINLNEKVHRDLHGELPDVINVKDSDEIYENLSRILQDKSKLNLIAVNAQIWLKKHFDLRVNIEKYVKIYEKILQ
jgi:glycosyltransferase involved in cell wall biosynthesis